jgi:hypothetical protein
MRALKKASMFLLTRTTVKRNITHSNRATRSLGLFKLKLNIHILSRYKNLHKACNQLATALTCYVKRSVDQSLTNC